MEETKKFQISTFDTIARLRLVEDQNTILDFFDRIQKLQNEINCMNDSNDFQDAEWIRSGNYYVTNRPMSFSPHPIPEGILRHYISCRYVEKKDLQSFGTHMIYRETFLQIQMHLHQLCISKNCIHGVRQPRIRSINVQWRKVKEKKKRSEMSIWSRQPKIQSSSLEKTLQRITERSDNDWRFRIFTSTNSSHQLRLLTGR